MERSSGTVGALQNQWPGLGGGTDFHLLLAVSPDLDSRLRRALAHTGLPLHLEAASSGEQTFSALANRPFDCALIERNLPAFAGASDLETWRRRGIETPIVVMIDREAPGQAIRLIEAGAYDCLEQTDIDGHRLMICLHAAVRAHRMEARLAATEKQLAQLTLHDPLTKLPGRVLFLDRLEQALLLAQREQRGVALLLFDLNKFAEVNRTFGHYAGDRLLEYAATRLGAILRGSDTLARIGDDQFAVAMPSGASRAGILTTAQKLIDALAPPFEIGGQAIAAHGAIGLALYPTHGATADQLLAAACEAVRAAKAQGRVSAFPPDADGVDPEPTSLAQELRQAIQNQEFIFHYQPVIDLQSGRICAVEALIRWHHAERGLIAPDTFIPLAEQIGMIDAITFWELDTAFAQMAAWRERGLDLPVCINLSALSIRNPRLVPAIEERLSRWKFPSPNLSLEITESAIIHDAANAADTLRRLHRLGIGIAVDDFGTGYTSLAYLRKLPLNRIKIDKSFVLNMRSVGDDAIIVRTLLELGRSLGLQVVAEGVEDEQTWTVLRNMGCTLAQGYFMGRPMAPAALDRWLEESTFGFGRLPRAAPSLIS